MNGMGGSFTEIGGSHAPEYAALSEDQHDRIHFFNHMRVKRNKNLYDHAGLISETEGRQIINSAEKHIEVIKKLLL